IQICSSPASTTNTNPPQPFLYARVAGAWVNRQPEGETGVATRITQGGTRVFVSFDGVTKNTIWRFGGTGWIPINNPLNTREVQGLAATGANALWATQWAGQEGPIEHLYYWNGTSWQYASDVWPQLAGYEGWRELDAVGSTLWMVSSRYHAAENVAYWDGSDWTVLDTPELLHGWSFRDPLVEATPGGVYIHDGIRLWTYEHCVP
ncbi:MAG TPA: hypothetical protein VM869_25700, partial [Enhygromyxa sp.]|nr:hypothetical protein [Enhygromyxa sp.]